jgi:hypothetical protein
MLTKRIFFELKIHRIVDELKKLTKSQTKSKKGFKKSVFCESTLTDIEKLEEIITVIGYKQQLANIERFKIEKKYQEWESQKTEALEFLEFKKSKKLLGHGGDINRGTGGEIIVEEQVIGRGGDGDEMVLENQESGSGGSMNSPEQEPILSGGGEGMTDPDESSLKTGKDASFHTDEGDLLAELMGANDHKVNRTTR